MGKNCGAATMCERYSIDRRFLGWAALLAACWLPGCSAISPSNAREWAPELAILPYAEFRGDLVHVHNVRNCTWLTANDYVVNHYDRVYDLGAVKSVDFIVSPFMSKPNLAHTMLSFGFGQGEYLALSVEIRREVGESFNPLAGFARQYELMYVLGDERDLIQLSSNKLNYPVYLYPGRAPPEKARLILSDVLQRTNQLRQKPEFYNTLTNNCTSNLVQHVNRISPGRVPLSYKTVFTGFSDELAFDLGLIENQGDFEQTKELALINELAQRYAEAPDFSTKIRDPVLRREAAVARKTSGSDVRRR